MPMVHRIRVNSKLWICEKKRLCCDEAVHPIPRYQNQHPVQWALVPSMDRTYTTYRRMVYHSTGMAVCWRPVVEVLAKRDLTPADWLSLAKCICWPLSPHWPPPDCKCESEETARKIIIGKICGMLGIWTHRAPVATYWPDLDSERLGSGAKLGKSISPSSVLHTFEWMPTLQCQFGQFLHSRVVRIFGELWIHGMPSEWWAQHLRSMVAVSIASSLRIRTICLKKEKFSLECDFTWILSNTLQFWCHIPLGQECSHHRLHFDDFLHLGFIKSEMRNTIWFIRNSETQQNRSKEWASVS